MTSRRIPVLAIVATSLLALAALQPGLDYFLDSVAIDDLARGDWDGFFVNQPLMGSLTLFLRAVLIKPVFHSSLTVVFFVGAAPCVAALLWLVVALLRRMRERARADRALVVLVCLGSVPFVRIFHWGHPEDVLAAALAVGALFVADRQRPLVAGLMVGLAAASKQWAILAGLPALLLLPGWRARAQCFGIAAGTWALLTLPMLIGNPERFWLVMRASGSADPTVLLNGDPAGVGAHVNPWDVWLPFGTRSTWGHTDELFVNSHITAFSHPLMLAVCIGLPLALWLRHRTLDLLPTMKLLALVLLLRCALDPMSLEYYHLPLLVALAAAAAIGGRRELDVAVLTTAGLNLAMVEPALNLKGVEHWAWLKFTLYMATVLPVAWLLARDLGLLPARRPRPAPRAATA